MPLIFSLYLSVDDCIDPAMTIHSQDACPWADNAAGENSSAQKQLRRAPQTMQQKAWRAAGGNGMPSIRHLMRHRQDSNKFTKHLTSPSLATNNKNHATIDNQRQKLTNKKAGIAPGLFHFCRFSTVDRKNQAFLCEARRVQVSTTVSGFSEMLLMP
ncbi:hypothetical protein [Quatrionicoccus australiensis]|uniref:hypothetical protein n=1 Tax=Quatrionicoccus australiensis TaxID=138118 RepID=UPI001CF90952|nr:hypothetical protein [Quatrionicoccus australiensis]UCV13683.1 hypothetical protein KI612_12025 [Quatrionicoccus australiensis]